MTLYTDDILEHSKYPRNATRLTKPSLTVSEENPSCGDSFELELSCNAKGTVTGIALIGSGCALSTAAASMLSERVRGMSLEQIAALSPDDVYALIGGPVNPGRTKCALLPLSLVRKAALLLATRKKSTRS